MTGATELTAEKNKGNFVVDVLKLVGGTTLVQAMGILFSPVLSRLYAPQAFGTAAVFNSIVGIVGSIACLRYEFAIMLPDQDDEAANVLALSLLFPFLFALLSAFLILSSGEIIARLLNAPELAAYLWLIPLAVLSNGGFRAIKTWVSRMQHFGRLSVAQIFQSVITKGAQLGIGVWGQPQAGGLINSTVLGSSTFTGLLSVLVWCDNRDLFVSSVRMRSVINALTRYRKFPLLDTWGALFNILSWQLPIWMLSAFFSQAMVGHYALANRVIQFPMSLIGGALSQVFFQRASQVHSEGEGLAGIVLVFYRRLVAIGLFPSLLVTVVGRDLFVVVFGAEWAEAGVFSQILGLWTFFWFISSPLSTLFIVLEHQELSLLVHLSIFATRVVSIIVGGVLGNIHFALALFAASGVLVYGGLAVWNMILAGVSLRSFFDPIILYGKYAVLAVAGILLLKLFSLPVWSILAVSAGMLSVYYISVMRNNPELSEIILDRLRSD